MDADKPKELLIQDCDNFQALDKIRSLSDMLLVQMWEVELN